MGDEEVREDTNKVVHFFIINKDGKTAKAVTPMARRGTSVRTLATCGSLMSRASKDDQMED
jgi:hypothetical protein